MIAESSTDIFNQLTDQYTNSISNVQSGSIAIGSELFNVVALISIALLGLNFLLRKSVDLADAQIDLIKWLLYLNVFYAFIIHYGDIYNAITNFFDQAGNYLGSKASFTELDITPANIIGIGYKTAKSILFANLVNNLFRNFLMVFISVLVAAVVMYCFAVIGLELILIEIGSHIILAGGIFLLAFSGLQWTRDYAERYVHTFFHIGIKMIFIKILAGIGVGLVKNWSQILGNVSLGHLIDYDIAICMSTYVYYKLCLKLPDQAVSWLTGRLAMGFDTAADVKSAVTAVPKMAVAAVSGGVAVAHGISGMSKAVSVAGQAAKTKLEAKGEKPNALNTGWETIKTLGEANKAVKQEALDKKISETKGGKIAKNISDNIPKPKKTRAKKFPVTDGDIMKGL